MKKPSKVVFISDDLEESFNSLSEDDFIKKSIKRAVKDLKQMPLQAYKYQKD